MQIDNIWDRDMRVIRSNFPFVTYKYKVCIFGRPVLLNCSSFKLQILQLLLSLLWNFSWFKKPNDPLLTSRWSLLKCLSFKKKFASEKGILSELDPKQDSGFSLNLQISDFK